MFDTQLAANLQRNHDGKNNPSVATHGPAKTLSFLTPSIAPFCWYKLKQLPTLDSVQTWWLVEYAKTRHYMKFLYPNLKKLA